MNLWTSIFDKNAFTPFGRATKEDLEKLCKAILADDTSRKKRDECMMKGHEGQYGKVLFPSVKIISIYGDKITTSPDNLYKCSKCDATYKLEDLDWGFRTSEFIR